MKVYEEINLIKNSHQHLYIQLYRALKKLILQRQIKEGEQLPPVRKMAKILNINTVTVVKAYEILEKEEILYKRMGSGTFVSPGLHQVSRNRKNVNLQEDIQAVNDGLLPMALGEMAIDEQVVNFAGGSPASGLFPIDDFKLAINLVLDRDQGAAFEYQEGQGYLPLRKAIQEYISTSGIEEEIDNIHIISGAQQGIDIVSKALLNYGDYVLMENPTYTGAMGAFRSRGARILDIPLEKDGLNLAVLEKRVQAHRPKLLYVMPNFQNPTGISYSQEKKIKLIELADQYHFYILEDDYLSDFSFHQEPCQTLKVLDHGERVIYIKSFSQILMPGLRLGFLLIPQSIQNQLLMAKHNSDISTSGLLQRAFEAYLRQGKWEEHIQHMERNYQQRYEMMKQAIKDTLPMEMSCDLPVGGVNFWVKLPKGISSEELLEAAQKQGIIFVSGGLFFVNNTDDTYFRLNIAGIGLHQIQAGTEKLFEIAKQLIQERK